MAPVIPDWGIFSTPRREPHFKDLAESLESPQTPSTPKLSKLTLNSPTQPHSHKTVDTPTSSGISFGFYKSPKPSTSAQNTPNAQCSVPKQRHSLPMSGRKKMAGQLNKGVGHSIKKPKLKNIEEKKKKQKMEETAKKIKERATCIPSNRSPVKTPNSTGKVPKESFIPEHASGKFFTSRSRAAATVQISRNIKLSAKYGDVSLNQKTGKSFVKKNIGRLVEEKLDQYIQQPTLSKGINEVSPLPSVSSDPKPAPTRVPSSPSPTKKPQSKASTASPCERATVKHKLDTSLGEELQDMEQIMKEWDADDNNEKVNNEEAGSSKSNCAVETNGTSTPIRRSPRKADGCASPIRKSPRKQQHLESPNTPNTTPSKKKHTSRIVESPRVEKTSASPVRRSPRKMARLVVQNGEKREKDVPHSPSKKVKFFPIFYPNTKLTDCKFAKSKTRKSHKKCIEMDEDQMLIDAGQKEFGAKQCRTCGVVFELGNTSDESSHMEFHNNMMNALKYTGWKKENLARETDHLGGRVLIVTSRDSQHWWQKVEEVREVVDNELGFNENSIKTKEHTKIFMYVLDHFVVGCLIAEKVDKAYRVIPRETDSRGSGLLCCSQFPSKVWVGISRIWVLRSKRGKGIASTLVDAMRSNMIDFHILSMNQFAFSDPTEAGLSFAEKYTGRPDFLVYCHKF